MQLRSLASLNRSLGTLSILSRPVPSYFSFSSSSYPGPISTSTPRWSPSHHSNQRNFQTTSFRTTSTATMADHHSQEQQQASSPKRRLSACTSRSPKRRKHNNDDDDDDGVCADTAVDLDEEVLAVDRDLTVADDYLSLPLSPKIDNTAVFICDIQEKFRNAIFEFDKVVLTARKVLKVASLLSIPIYATTQNRARLGPTVPELAELLREAGPLVKEDSDKTRFSMWTPSVARRLPGPSSSSPGGRGGGGRRTAVAIVGIESHICVTQTALDLLAAGHDVYVLSDGVSSCNREEVPVALRRLAAAGAVVTTSESWAYEVMGDAALPEFRAMVGLVKETAGDTRAALGALVPAKM